MAARRYSAARRTGPPRRHRPTNAFTIFEDPATPARLVEAFATRAATVDADTVNRELSVLRAAISWWHGQGWLQADPTAGLERRPAPPDRTRALTRDQISALFALDVGLRDKTYWRLLMRPLLAPRRSLP